MPLIFRAPTSSGAWWACGEIALMMAGAWVLVVWFASHRDGNRPGFGTGEKALALAVTEMIHGANATTEAIRASEILFGGGLEGISESIFSDIIGEVPTKEIARDRFEGVGIPLVELLAESGLCPSKGQGRKDIEGGGIYLNNERVVDPVRCISTSDLLFGKYMLLRKGKRTYAVLSAR